MTLPVARPAVATSPGQCPPNSHLDTLQPPARWHHVDDDDQAPPGAWTAYANDPSGTLFSMHPGV